MIIYHFNLILRLFPSITATTVRSFLQPPIRGVVLQTYGAGNGPNNREDIIREIRLACSRGVLIVNISQCHSGKVRNWVTLNKNQEPHKNKFYHKGGVISPAVFGQKTLAT